MIGAAGCGSSGPRALAPNKSSASTTSSVAPLPTTGLTVSTSEKRPSAPCRIGDLAFDYYGGQAGAGSDFGTIRIRDIAARPCGLRGPVIVSGADTMGRIVTQTVSYDVAAPVALTAHAAMLPNMQPPPAGEVVADLLMSASYRDDNSSPNGLCTTHRVIPETWRLTFAGVTRTVANVSHDPDPQWPSLVTCKGEIDTPDKIGSSANGS
jgi:hypothetical protein